MTEYIEKILDYTLHILTLVTEKKEAFERLIDMTLGDLLIKIGYVTITIFMVVGTVLVAFAIINAPPPIMEGEVYNKVYEPSMSWMTMMPISNGKTITFIPMWHYDDEDFVIYIHRWDNELQKDRTNALYVNESTYNEISIGDYVRYDEGNMETVDPDIRQRR